MFAEYNLESFFKNFYLDSNIPVYLYENQKMIFSIPQTDTSIHIPEQYKEKLFKSQNRISFCSTDYGICFSSLRLHADPNICILFGPVSNTPFSDSDLHSLYVDYVIPNDRKKEFLELLRSIP